MKAPEKQQKIKTLVNRLSEFNPDKIALEFERKDSNYVDSLYRSYRNGDYELNINEQ